MLKTVHREALQIVRRGIDCAVRGGLGDLGVSAVLARTAIQGGLPGVKAADAAVDVFQGKAVHRGCKEADVHCLQCLKKLLRIGKIRHCTGIAVCGAGFCSHDPAGCVIRPLHGAVRKIVAIQEAHLVPAVAQLIGSDGQHLHGCVTYKLTEVPVTVIILDGVFVDVLQNARIGRDADIIAGRGKHRRIGVFFGRQDFFHIRNRKLFGCITRFARFGLKPGSIIRCFRIRLLFIGHSVLLRFRRISLITPCRLFTADDEQRHQADVCHALAYGEETDLRNIPIQQIAAVQIIRAGIAADDFARFIQEPHLHRCGSGKLGHQNEKDILRRGVDQRFFCQRSVAIYGSLVDGGDVDMTMFVKRRLNREPVVRLSFLLGCIVLTFFRHVHRLIGERILCIISLQIVGRHVVRVVIFGFSLLGRGTIRSGFAVAMGFIGCFRFLQGRCIIFFLDLLFIGRERRLRHRLAIRGDDRGKIGGRCGFRPCTHRPTAECHAHRQHKRCKPFDFSCQLHVFLLSISKYACSASASSTNLQDLHIVVGHETGIMPALGLP